MCDACIKARKWCTAVRLLYNELFRHRERQYWHSIPRIWCSSRHQLHSTGLMMYPHTLFACYALISYSDRSCMPASRLFRWEEVNQTNQTISSIKAWMQCSLVACRMTMHTIACCCCKITLVRYCPHVWIAEGSNTSLHQPIAGQDQSLPEDAICDIPSIHVDD